MKKLKYQMKLNIKEGDVADSEVEKKSISDFGKVMKQY